MAGKARRLEKNVNNLYSDIERNIKNPRNNLKKVGLKNIDIV